MDRAARGLGQLRVTGSPRDDDEGFTTTQETVAGRLASVQLRPSPCHRPVTSAPLTRRESEVLALVAGEDGLQSLRDIAAQARDYFQVGGGWLMLEHGYDQAPELLQMLPGLGYERVEDFADLAGIPRVTVALWRGSDE